MPHLTPTLLSAPLHQHLVISVEIDDLMKIHLLFPLSVSSVATMNSIHRIWKITKLHVMLNKGQFTQHMYSRMAESTKFHY